MSKADQPTTPILSRRAALAGVMSAAALPVAVALPVPAMAVKTDPIFAAIERHKAAAAIWDAAVSIRGDSDESDRDETLRLDVAVDEAWEPCVQAGLDLLDTEPTTLAGIVAAIQYMRAQMLDDGTYMPHHLEYEGIGDANETMGWIDAFLDTIASAAAALDKAVA
jgi:hypothetical protein